MKNIYFLVFMCTSTIIFAQVQDVKLSSLKAPSAPAFSILGTQPKDIVRPKALNSFEASLLNAVSNDGTYALPNSFALEATPFWLKSQKITFEEMEEDKNLLKRMGRNFSFSAATSQRKNLKDTTLKVSQLGLGFRTLLAQGSLADNKEVAIISKELNTIIEVVNRFDEVIQLIDNYNSPINDPSTLTSLLVFPFEELRKGLSDESKTQLDNLVAKMKKDNMQQQQFEHLYEKVAQKYIASQTVKNKNEASVVLDSLNHRIHRYLDDEKEFIGKVEKIKTFREKRVGLIWELAGAFGLESPNGKYRTLQANRIGIWSTWTIRPEEKQDIELAFMLRYLYTNTELHPKNPNNIDVGLQFAYDNGKWMFSGEGLLRANYKTEGSDFDGTWGSRYGVSLGYRVTEGILIQGTLGKTFDNDFINPGGLISVLGANFGFGQAAVSAHR